LTATTNKDQWIEETKWELEEKERQNCTFHPKINDYKPKRQEGEGDDESHTSYGVQEGTGDKCFDLYQLALIKRQ